MEYALYDGYRLNLEGKVGDEKEEEEKVTIPLNSFSPPRAVHRGRPVDRSIPCIYVPHVLM